MPTNDFKPFSVAGGANVISQADYEALAALSTGFTSGVAKANEINKVLRQASFIAAALAQFVSDKGNVDVLDDGSVSGFVTKMTNAFAAQYLSRSNPFGDIKADGTAALAAAFANLGLGSAAKNNTGDFISSSGGNYTGYLRMTGIETLPTEPTAANLSSLYSAPSPIPSGAIVAGGVANWYTYQAMWGLIRNASTGINGWGVQINGSTLFLIAPNGDCYSNNAKLATETVVTNGLNGKQAKDQTLTDLSGKTQAQLRTYLQLGDAAQKTIGNGPGQVPDMSLFPLVGGANGYVKLPNGFIFQWGSANAGAGSANIAFPMQFPGGCVGVEVTGTSARASADMAGVNIIASEINAGGFGVNGYLIRPGGQVVPQGIAFLYCAWGY